MRKKVQAGFVLPTLLSLIIALSIIIFAVAGLIEVNFNSVNNNTQSQKAFNVAEAGINYYLWHLSHNSSDYKDGQSTPATPDATLGYGPYVHNYIDTNAKTTGTYTLWIKPQGNGSTVATVRSIGQVSGSSAKRIIEAKVGAPSFASYALVSDTQFWFGNTESADGPVHSNQGIRMDGSSNSDVTSSNATYVPTSQLGGNGSTSHPGVWCDTSVTTPVNCNTRSKVDWRYPVTSVDFNIVTSSLCTIKKLAFSSDASTSALASNANACTQVPTTRTAAYIPQSATNGSFSVSKGYLITLNSNGTYDLAKVTAETDTQTSYSTALSTTAVATGIAIPTSGVIFAEDNVWVRTSSTFAGRVTIASGRLASSTYSTDIVIADDILYSNKNGNDAIGLITEDSVLVAPYAIPQTGNFTFEVDAAIIAQSGSVSYPDQYRSSANCTKGWTGASQKYLFYGSVSTRQTWTWTWQMNNSCGSAALDSASGKYISGVKNNTTSYDYNLMYAPPPSFPITSTYNILSWREVLTKP
jgi:Tfp pilus assembly protein PilX